MVGVYLTFLGYFNITVGARYKARGFIYEAKTVLTETFLAITVNFV